MKKLFLLTTLLFAGIILTGCSTSSPQATTLMSSQKALGAMAYISASFLDENTSVSPQLSSSVIKLSATTAEVVVVEPTTEIETELDEVNIYVDKLKGFIEGGASGFGDIQEQVSDNAEYAHMIVITVAEEGFVLYYNIDLVTNEITGLFILDGVEYTIVAQNSLSDSDEFGNDDDDEVDTEDPADAEEDAEEADAEVETEFEMELVATAVNGDSITITYEVEIETDETEKSFTIVKNIGGVEYLVDIQIEQDGEEFSLEITQGGNTYEFTVEVEDDGETVYILEYEVNGVTGSVKITETINDLGETVYKYQITEAGTEVNRELADPDEDDDDEEEIDGV